MIDHDVQFARQWFSGRIADGKWKDPEVVRRSWDDALTIVTANGTDFVREILRHQRKHPCTADNCHDMNGLVVIPNHEFKAKNALDAAVRKGGLRAGKTPLTLDDVAEHNLYAKYHADGTVEVKRFPRCRYRDAEDVPPWYSALKVVGEE